MPTDKGYDWTKEHDRLWDALVPKAGQADTLQGELIRIAGKLTDQAYRNGNMNWDADHERLWRFVGRHLDDPGTFDDRTRAAIRALSTKSSAISPTLTYPRATTVTTLSASALSIGAWRTPSRSPTSRTPRSSASPNSTANFREDRPIMHTRLLPGLFALVTCTAAALGLARPDDAIVFDRDVVYTTRPDPTGDIQLKLNLARPTGEGKNRPCIVAIHGGAWRAGNREQLDTLVQELAKQGYVAATVSYRFCPKDRFPAQVEDCAAAVRFLRANADKYGIDPTRFGAIGFSAGAHLSMMLGVLDCADGFGICGTDPKDSGKVQAVVSFFGPTLLCAPDIPQQSKGLVAEFVGPDPEGLEDRLRVASLLTYITPGDAPTLMFQGTKDPLVPDTQPGLLLEAMSKAGVAGRAEIIAGAGHGWGGAELERTISGSW